MNKKEHVSLNTKKNNFGKENAFSRNFPLKEKAWLSKT